MKDTIVQILMAFGGSLGFGLIFHIRAKLLFPAAIGGLMAWCVNLIFVSRLGNAALASFFAAAFAAFYAEILARLMKAPSTLFFVPAVVPLIPGASLYYTVSSIVAQNWPQFRQYGAETTEYALSIAAGMCLAWAFAAMTRKIRTLAGRIAEKSRPDR